MELPPNYRYRFKEFGRLMKDKRLNGMLRDMPVYRDPGTDWVYVRISRHVADMLAHRYETVGEGVMVPPEGWLAGLPPPAAVIASVVARDNSIVVTLGDMARVDSYTVTIWPEGAKAAALTRDAPSDALEARFSSEEVASAGGPWTSFEVRAVSHNGNGDSGEVVLTAHPGTV